MVTDSIEREVAIAAPVERVWALLTQAEHLAAWFGDAGAEIDLRPGGAMTISWDKHGTALARVERVDPPRAFAFRWGTDAGVPPDPGTSTLVEFTLTPADDGGTRVHVRESGFAGLHGGDADRARRAAENTEGWEIELGHLADLAQRVAA